MDWPAFSKLIHVALAMALVTGVAGRWVVLRAARRSERLDRTIILLELAAPFERLVILSSVLVVPAGLLTAAAQGYPWFGLTTPWMLVSTLVFVAIGALVPMVFLPRGRRFEGAISRAREVGTVTPELRAAWDDRLVDLAHRGEALGIGVVVALMVLKPAL